MGGRLQSGLGIEYAKGKGGRCEGEKDEHARTRAGLQETRSRPWSLLQPLTQHGVWAAKRADKGASGHTKPCLEPGSLARRSGSGARSKNPDSGTKPAGARACCQVCAVKSSSPPPCAVYDLIQRLAAFRWPQGDDVTGGTRSQKVADVRKRSCGLRHGVKIEGDAATGAVAGAALTPQMRTPS